MEVTASKIGTLTGHSGCIYDMDVGAEPHLIFSGGGDRVIAQWNLTDLDAGVFVAKFPEYLYEICHIPEKKLLLAGTSAGNVHIINLETKEEIKILQHHKGAIFEINYSISNNCFYTAGEDGNFAVCSLDTLSLIQIKKLCDKKIRSIDFNYSQNEIAVAGGDGKIRIFDLTTLSEKNEFEAHKSSVNSVRYSPDEKLLLSGGKDAHLNIWNCSNYECLKSIPAHNFAIYDIVFSPDKTMYATGSRDKTVKIWDAKTHNVLLRINKEKFDGHINSVNKLLWLKYNNYLISTGDDKTIMVWEIVSEKSKVKS